jgi:mannose-6-phosphate isomerase-like protein (cupin superfamily)
VIVAGERYMVISRESNQVYWMEPLYPAWTRLNAFRHFPGQRAGHGVEPHYHDGDELWLFIEGQGEVWLDDRAYPLAPNTAVYTPMGVVHRFQMFTPFSNLAVVTRLEGQKRATHISVEEHGRPRPTAQGFVVPGAENVAAFPDRGARCPLGELRLVTADAPELGEARTTTNEHWMALEEGAGLTVDGVQIEMSAGDVALFRPEVTRRLVLPATGRAVLARE